MLEFLVAMKSGSNAVVKRQHRKCDAKRYLSDLKRCRSDMKRFGSDMKCVVERNLAGVTLSA